MANNANSATGRSAPRMTTSSWDWWHRGAGLAALVTAGGFVLLVAMLLAFAVPVFGSGGSGSPFAWQWQPAQGTFGILPMLAGSLILSLSALLLGWPLALALAAFLCTLPPPAAIQSRGATMPTRLHRNLGRLAQGIIRIMTAIPTVVYGFAAVFLLTPLIRAGFGGTGMGWITAVYMLVLLIVPTMVLVLQAGMAPRLAELGVSGLAVGFSRMDIVWHFVLPQCRTTLLCAAVLGFGRAAGDTLLPLMLAGNAPQLPTALGDSVRTLTAHMALVTANEVGGAAYNSLFAAGALLLGINAAVTLALRRFAPAPPSPAAPPAPSPDPFPVPPHIVTQPTSGTPPTDAAAALATPVAVTAGMAADAAGERHGETPEKRPADTATRTAAVATAAAACSPQSHACHADGHTYRVRKAGRTRRGKPLWLRGFALLGWVSSLSITTAVGVLILFLLRHGLPACDSTLFFGDTPPLDALLGVTPVWDGIWPACTGTLSLVGLTMLMALAPGLGCGIYLAHYAAPAMRRYIGLAVDMLAGMPSIIMGLFGYTLIVLLRHTLMPEANTCLLLAAGCLALLVLPVLVAATREALEAVPHSLRLSAAALGMSRAATLRHVLLPAASAGLGSGVVLALGRAAEDTAVILLTGVVVNAGLGAGLGGKFEALPFHIYYTAAQYQSQEELTRGFGASLVLLTLSVLLLWLAHAARRKHQHRWQGSYV